MFKKHIALILLMGMLLMSTETSAQDCTDPSTPGPSPCPPGQPIDGGVGLLIALGAAYGYKKLRKED